jgi:hypothetical protein
VNDDIVLLQRLGLALDSRIGGTPSTSAATLNSNRKKPRAKVPAPHDLKKSRAGASGPYAQVTVRDFLIRSLLKVRSKARGLVVLNPNRAQREFAESCTHRNIVLKARQMGITTYVAARFFVQTITRPGTMTVQVAHDQESAEEIFKIVHRFWENLPETMKRGALTRSRANVRQMVFPRIDSEYRVATAAEAKMDMLAGGPQPGRMSLAEQKIAHLEHNDIRRSVYNRLVNAVITVTISAIIAFHDKWWH